jgi:hypothetical protein
MKKVYLIIDEGCFDYDCGTDVRVYADHEKAKQDFDDCREQLIAEWIDDGSWVIECDKEDFFSVCEDGDYTRSHAAISIVEKDILS